MLPMTIGMDVVSIVKFVNELKIHPIQTSVGTITYENVTSISDESGNFESTLSKVFKDGHNYEEISKSKDRWFIYSLDPIWPSERLLKELYCKNDKGLIEENIQVDRHRKYPGDYSIEDFLYEDPFRGWTLNFKTLHGYGLKIGTLDLPADYFISPEVSLWNSFLTN